MKFKKGWVVAGAASLAFAGYLVHGFLSRDVCPVVLPPEYKLVQYQPRASAASLALAQIDRQKDIGTSASWLFVAPGTVEQAADRVVNFLNASHTGVWRRLPNRHFVIFGRRANAPEVVMFPARLPNGDTTHMHQIRINGEWETPGGTEKLLSYLPRSWVDKLAQDK